MMHKMSKLTKKNIFNPWIGFFFGLFQIYKVYILEKTNCHVSDDPDNDFDHYG